ncbi:MAG: DUF1345 domain-containing protein [Tsuneonella sp.]
MARGRAGAVPIGNRLAPARYLLFLALLIGGYFTFRAVLPGDDWRDGAAMAFDGAAAVFLLSLWPLTKDSAAADIRGHAAQNDANRVLILILTSGLMLVAMAAIAGEMKGAQGGDLVSIVKLVGTLLLIWLFANSVFALHYAHTFYSQKVGKGGDCGGIDFPATDTPNYWDFAYFAFTLGMTFQTSDVVITARPVRKIALLHSFAAFVFNIGVIAFTINVLGGGGS